MKISNLKGGPVSGGLTKIRAERKSGQLIKEGQDKGEIAGA